jgi:hypothetical protein
MRILNRYTQELLSMITIHPLFSVVSRDDASGILMLRLGEIPTVITIEIEEIEGSDLFALHASHGIKPPGTSLYFVRYREYSSPGEGLADFQRFFARTYKQAVDKGHRPSEAWLVVDKDFAYLLEEPGGDSPRFAESRPRPKLTAERRW